MIWLIVMSLLIAINVIVLEFGVVSRDTGISFLFSLLLGEFLGAGILSWNQYRDISYKFFGSAVIIILMGIIAKLWLAITAFEAVEDVVTGHDVDEKDDE